MGVSTTTGRFKTWPLNGDFYENTDLADNWNALDALIGVAFTGARPLYNEIAALKQEREPLGTIKMWYRFTSNYSPPTGYVICDGVTTVGTNDLKDNNGAALPTNTLTPNLIGKVMVGANIARSDGSAWAVGTTSATAPGIGGTGGSNDNLAINIVLPPHYHTHSHIHQIGPTTTGDHFETTNVPTGQNMLFNAQTGGAQSAAKDTHKHNISIYSSKARLDINADTKVSDLVSNPSTQESAGTSLPLVNGVGGSSDHPSGGTSGDTLGQNLSVDARPAGIGLLPIMKVRYTTVA